MYILAIETTGPLGSVAIIDGDGKIMMETSSEEMNHLKDLMPMAQRLIEKFNISKSDLSAVAASIGPGSFTGIRIGVSSARAVAQSLEIPCISAPTLELFKEKADGVNLIVPIFNARRGQVYGAIFDENGLDIVKPGPYMLIDILAKLDGHKNVIFYGDGIDAYEGMLIETEGYQLAPKKARYQSADMVARMALAKYMENDTLQVNELLPDYMRVAEAEQKLKDGSLARERAAKLAKFKSR